MNGEQFCAIEEAIAIIEKEIRHALDLDRLSKEVGLSKYHLHRLFKSITGKSLMSYVRSRKLSQSIVDLISTNRNIIDIAQNYQFEHEQSYIRAFKQKFGITPAQYRKLKYELPIEQKIDTHYLRLIGQGLMIQPQMCIKPKFYVQGIQKEIIHEENLIHQDANKLAMIFQEMYMPLIEHVLNKEVYIGLVRYTDHPEYSNYYVPCLEITSLSQVTPPFVQYTIPMQEYAIFRYIGLHSPYEITYATLKALYDFIDLWKMETSYRQSSPFHFEKMNLKICSASYCEMDIYIPITAQ